MMPTERNQQVLKSEGPKTVFGEMTKPRRRRSIWRRGQAFSQYCSRYAATHPVKVREGRRKLSTDEFNAKVSQQLLQNNTTTALLTQSHQTSLQHPQLTHLDLRQLQQSLTIVRVYYVLCLRDSLECFSQIAAIFFIHPLTVLCHVFGQCSTN